MPVEATFPGLSHFLGLLFNVSLSICPPHLLLYGIILLINTEVRMALVPFHKGWEVSLRSLKGSFSLISNFNGIPFVT